jgi:hypothetical protein
MVKMLDELKERNILKLILIVRFACATLDVEHFIFLISNDAQIATSSVISPFSPIGLAREMDELNTSDHGNLSASSILDRDDVRVYRKTAKTPCKIKQ